jgi:hypothetical protein
MSGTLMCRYTPIDLAGFLLGFLPFGTATFVGLLQGGYGWYLLGWLAYWLFFFFGWEARILCSHCPFWAEGGRVLHCHANYGVYKIWRFHPEPMSTLEKAQFMLGSAVFIGYPFVFLLFGETVRYDTGCRGSGDWRWVHFEKACMFSMRQLLLPSEQCSKNNCGCVSQAESGNA